MNTQTLLTQYVTLLEANTSQDMPTRWVFDSAFNYFYAGDLLAKQGLRVQAHNSLRMGLEGEYNLQKCRRGWDECNNDVRDVRQPNHEVI